MGNNMKGTTWALHKWNILNQIILPPAELEKMFKMKKSGNTIAKFYSWSPLWQVFAVVSILFLKKSYQFNINMTIALKHL